MKIGILHLTDLHIHKEIHEERIEKLVRAIEYDIKQISNLYIVFSGDIVNYGRESEYENAKLFLKELLEKVKCNKSLLQIEVVAVPGNHDCCFDNEKKTRKSIINDCKTDFIEEEDYFIDAMAVQADFWNFLSEVTSFKEKNQIAYKYEFRPHIDFRVTFNCYNTSWLTEIHEKQGSLIVPENKFLDNENEEYVISVFHHPIDWLSANTKRNNKQRFEEHLINSSNLVIYGHEHDKGKSKGIIQQKQNVVFCGGKAFDKKEIIETGFSFYEIDLNDKSINIKTYNYDGKIYSIEFEDKHKIVAKNKREFILRDEFEKEITKLNIPLKHSKKENLVLSDVFVYPDLEPLVDDDTVQYPNSSELIEKIKEEKNSNILIEGADQSGKTTLLFVLYKRFYEMGFTPIYLRGKHCKETNVKTLVKKSLKEQYNNNNVDLFFQQETKILLLDNFHKSELNSKYKKKLIDSINENFQFVFLTSDNMYSTKNVTEEATSLKDYSKFKLLPLGYEKRSELIEQWLLIGENELTIQEEVLLEEVKLRFNEIDALIGNRLMPSYPIFILTLLQSLEENLQNFSQTSYANIYLVLIKAGLLKEGMKDNILTSLLNILKELAFYLYNDLKSTVFKAKDFEEFITQYSEKYFRHQKLTSDKILSVLCNSNILKVDDEYYSFSYKYIFYFLIAQKISSEIEKHQELIYDLCNKIHLEVNANILIFLSHHSKAQILIDNIVLTSEIPFENFSPLSLNKDDEFVKFITEFTNEIKDEIIEEINPKEEVKRDLRKKDVLERKNLKNEEENEDQDQANESVLPEQVIEMNQAFRTVKIIGQIVKNQSGDFEKEKLIKLVEAAYNTMFRFLGFYSEILVKDKDLLIEAIVENIKEKENKKWQRTTDVKAIERAVKKMLQFISWRICVDSMTNLMFSVGTKGQNELFEKVNLNIDSTASKLVTFAIKTYYDKIDTKELSKLFEDVRDNYLAQCILREYIKRYLYTNFVERKKRDQIIQIAGFNKQRLIGRMKSH
ncbi:metallophosphoesterase [Chryseobacterium suipulveris]|uniref:Metallophosphoesterase n=1 Tax=Chryseobacterium suipulveris TaxID=2929800 RepID=A0ABY4BMI6_9FLAO|nr:metallophosphoesterase [Chryseobacterium suipulveris]UOE40320.1 metallophosphoesterase [Chryseobacterium suipulveris]